MDVISEEATEALGLAKGVYPQPRAMILGLYRRAVIDYEKASGKKHGMSVHMVESTGKTTLRTMPTRHLPAGEFDVVIFYDPINDIGHYVLRRKNDLPPLLTTNGSSSRDLALLLFAKLSTSAASSSL